MKLTFVNNVRLSLLNFRIIPIKTLQSNTTTLDLSIELREHHVNDCQGLITKFDQTTL